MTSPLSFDLSVVPAEPLSTERFRLAPLGPEHNESDFDAWMSSIDHIRATPGLIPGAALAVGWPTPMTSEENLSDLVNHADEFTRKEPGRRKEVLAGILGLQVYEELEGRAKELSLIHI